jgi:hypothetical protein
MGLRFQVGVNGHEYARVEVTGANGDGWLPSRVTVSAGGFRGEFPSDLDSWAFVRFAQEVRDLHTTLKGAATFSTYEKQLELALVGDGLGHITVTAEAMDYAGTGNKLIFRLDIDQTELPLLMKELDAIVAAYPPPGTSLERTCGR